MADNYPNWLNQDLIKVFEFVPVGMAVAAGSNSAKIKVNPLLGKMLGMAPGTSRRPGLVKAYQDSGELTDAELPLQVAARTGQPVEDFEFTIVHSDASVCSLIGWANPLLDKSGKSQGGLAIFIDTSLQKQELMRRKDNQ